MGRGKKRSGQGQSVERYVPCFGNRQESHGKKKKKRHGNSNELAHKVLLPLDQDTEENSKPLTQTAEVQQSPKKLVNEEQFSETLGHAATSEAMVFTSPKSLTQTPADTQQPSMVISSQAPTFQQDPTHITTPQQCPQLILAPTTQNDSDSEIQTTPQANGGKDVVFDSHIMDPFSDSCTGEERKIATLPCGEAKGHGLLARDTINTNGLDLSQCDMVDYSQIKVTQDKPAAEECGALEGIIQELSLLNEFILKSKRELESVGRQYVKNRP